MTLAAYACNPAASRGRRYAQAPAPTRSEFQRDRDRIVHSTAFRRLVYKTQVFLNHEGDLFRTRMTHSLEVAQLARSMARSLQVNEDLVEAISLAHDLGHTPFGHAGQDALNACMREHGGFEHNLQSLRVVDHLEHRYPDYDGLNLSFETREGILKHCSRANAQRLEALEPGGVASRFLTGGQPSLEAQLCNLADAIAYNAHDIDDGVRSGLLSLEQMHEVDLFAPYLKHAAEDHPNLLAQPRRWLYEGTRRMLSDQVYDVINSTQAALRQADVASLDDVRQAPVLVKFSDGMKAQSAALKQFLFASLYRHDQVTQMMAQAQTVVTDLFAAYRDKPSELPDEFLYGTDLCRGVADYIAGMTDRYAIREHARLTGKECF